MQRIVSLLALALFVDLVAVSPAQARRAPFKVEKRLDLRQRTQKPTFSAVSNLRLLDRGRQLYLGGGIWDEQHRFHLYDVRTRRRWIAAAPLQEFLRANPTTFPEADRLGRLPAYRVLELLYYDSRDGSAGILLQDAALAKRRTFYLHWDLGKNRILRAVILGTRDAGTHWIGVKAIGYDPDRKRFYCQIVRKRRVAAGQPAHSVSVLALGGGQWKRLATWLAKRRIVRGPFHDARGRRVLVVEYAEQGDAGGAPRGVLVDLASGARQTMELPVTTYGAAFSRNGKTVYVYSSQLGEVWAIRARDGRRLRRRRVGKLGHALGLVFKDTLLVLRNKGLRFLATRRLKMRRFVPVQRLYQGFSHVQGSVLGPGRAFIRNGSTLHVVALRRPR